MADGTTQVAAYAYDAMGRRIRKVVTNGGVTGDSALDGMTDYLYDGVQCIEERDGADAPVRLFIWGRYVDECVSMQTLVTLGGGSLPADVYIPFSDLLYRSTLSTNSSAAPVEAYDTDAYGNTIAYMAAGTGGNWFADDVVATDNPALQYIFTGRQIDPETGLYNYRARYYHLRLGRFSGRDPILWFRDANLYLYCGSNPVIKVDPTGHDYVITRTVVPGDSDSGLGILADKKRCCVKRMAAWDWYGFKTYNACVNALYNAQSTGIPGFLVGAVSTLAGFGFAGGSTFTAGTLSSGLGVAAGIVAVPGVALTGYELESYHQAHQICGETKCTKWGHWHYSLVCEKRVGSHWWEADSEEYISLRRCIPDT